MEIKDIAVSVEGLEEVRGGQFIDFDQYAVQVGGNTGVSSASNYGVNAEVVSGVSQYNPQTLNQSANINAVDFDQEVFSIDRSVLGLLGGYLR